jgi:hypothetical protein
VLAAGAFGTSPAGEPKAEIDAPTPFCIKVKEGYRAFCAAFSPDGKSLVYGRATTARAAVTFDFVVCDLPSGKERVQISGEDLAQSHFAFVTFSPDGKRLAIPCTGGAIGLWDSTTGKLLSRVKQHPSDKQINSLMFSPDGKHLAYVASGLKKDGSVDWTFSAQVIRVHGLSTQDTFRDLGTASGGIFGFSFSDDGRYVLVECWQHDSIEKKPRGVKHPVAFRITLRLLDFASGRDLGPVGKTREWKGGIETISSERCRDLRRSGATNGGFRVRFSPTGNVVLFPRDRSALVREWYSREWSSSEGLKKERKALTAAGLDRIQEGNRWWGALAFSRDGRTVTSAIWFEPETKKPNYLLLWRDGFLGPPRPSVSAEDLDARWKKLSDADPLTTFEAADALLQSPGPTVAMLERRLRPIRPRNVAALLRDLDDDDFDVREKATKELLEFDAGILPRLRKVLAADPPSLEVVRRVTEIVEELEENPRRVAESLRAIWGIELLERLDTPKARKLLAALAEGDPLAWRTQEAKASLRRLTGSNK